MQFCASHGWSGRYARISKSFALFVARAFVSTAARRPNYALKGTLRTLREFPGYDVGAGPLNAALGNMDVALRDIEDRTLAMSKGEYVHFRVARPVLGTFYERNVSFDELTSIVGRLSNLGLLRWRVRYGRELRFSKRAPVPLKRACLAEFTASAAGIEYLARPRNVL